MRRRRGGCGGGEQDPEAVGGRRQVHVVAPRVSHEVEALAAAGVIRLIRRPFQPADLDGALLAITATNDPGANSFVAAAARVRGVLVNAADDPRHCDFILPAVVPRGAVQVAVSTSGRSPALARHLRDRLADAVAPEYGELAEVLAEVRAELRRAKLRVPPEAWQRLLDDDGLLMLLRRGETDAALVRIRRQLAVAALVAPEGPRRAGERSRQFTAGSVAAEGRAVRPVNGAMGRVILVGAGPGDPDLITVAGLRAIESADVLVYDRLVHPDLVATARPEARRVYVGKTPGQPTMRQEEINRLLCAEALAGAVVVRLKGGDPFVFGRGGEEVAAAVAAGVPVQVIPGVSSAIAAPACAGIPVTHRGFASSFTVVTAHEDPTKDDGVVPWDALARVGGTLVILMGAERLAAVMGSLLRHGMPTTTPAAVIEAGTTLQQRVVTGTLDDIARRAELVGIRAPATAVVGPAAALAQSLAASGHATLPAMNTLQGTVRAWQLPPQ